MNMESVVLKLIMKIFFAASLNDNTFFFLFDINNLNGLV